MNQENKNKQLIVEIIICFFPFAFSVEGKSAPIKPFEKKFKKKSN